MLFLFVSFFLCFTFFELESLRFNFGIKSWSNPNFKNWLSLKSTYTFLFKALNSFCYSCLFVVFCAYLEEWRRQKHIKKRIQDNHYLFKGGNMRMASDEDYGHVARKNKDLGIQVTLALRSFKYYLKGLTLHSIVLDTIVSQ